MLSSLSIKTKLTWLIILTLCLPLFIFGFFWYHQSTSTIEKSATESSVQMIKQLNSQLDFYFKDLEQITLPIFTHPLIQKLLILEPEDHYERFHLRREIRKEIIPNILFSRPDIAGIAIVSYTGDNIISYGKTSGNEYVGEKIKEDNYKILNVSNDGGAVLTVSRKLIDLSTYQSNGLLIIDIDLNQLSKIISGIQSGKAGDISMIDSTGLTIFHQNKEEIGKRIPQKDIKRFLEKTDDTFTKGDFNDEKIVTYSHSSLTNLITIAEIPKKELMIDLIQLRNITIFYILVISILSLFFMGSFSYKLVRSLTRLQEKMKQAELGDLTVRADEDEQNEIGNVNKSFNKMVSEMERLIEVEYKSDLREKELLIKQREAILQSMQFQINPHFLYNALEIINSYAIVKGEMTISKMSTALADIFRYATEGIDYHVTLDKELENIENFIEIQRERYQDLKVEVHFDDTDTTMVQSVKLILQPIIENAFVHGYESKKLRPDFIRLVGELKKDYYLLEIIDKGNGMTRENMTDYNNAFAVTDLDEMNDINQVMLAKGIGLWNVHFRLRLAFGMPYGIYIRKSDHYGTVIQVKLPFESYVVL